MMEAFDTPIFSSISRHVRFVGVLARQDLCSEIPCVPTDDTLYKWVHLGRSLGWDSEGLAATHTLH
jgi:hypothetical protein